MTKFTFYIDGLNRETDVFAETEKAARKACWEALSPAEQDAVVCLDCIDEVVT